MADEIIHPNFKVHGAGGQVIEPGIEGLKQLVTAWRTGFPDAVQRVDEIMALGDTVIVRLTWEGTHLGEFMGMPPTGKKVSVGTIGIDRVVDGKVVEGWGELDMFGLCDTIGGMMPAGGGGGGGLSRSAPSVAHGRKGRSDVLGDPDAHQPE